MIDILLSTYNGEKYLGEQLDSILAQSYKDWHLIVRDDGSTDTTRAVLTSYSQKYPEKIEILPDHENIGCLRSFERLMQASEAPYCCFADQDDVWLTDKLHHALNEMQKAERQVPADTPLVVAADLEVVDEDLRLLDESFWHYVRLNPDLLQTPERLATCNYVTGCAMLFNRAALRVSLPFPPEAFMHDAVVALCTLHHGGIILRSPYRDVRYRQHGTNVLGAVPVRYNVRYVRTKICSLGAVLRRQRTNYRQAHALIGIGPLRFMYNRIHYLLKR